MIEGKQVSNAIELELSEIPGDIVLNSITHPHQPIKTGLTRLKPLSPGRNRFSPGSSHHVEGDGRTKEGNEGRQWGDNDRALKKVGSKH
jgi:hypothetical protein